MGGLSGAFLLLPFQMSILNFTTPSVSSTNLLFNIIAIPSGVYRYIREGRMSWPLTAVIVAGTLPGVFLGYYLRVLIFPDPGTFKLFVGLVLLYPGLRLLYEALSPSRPATGSGTNVMGKTVRTIAFTLRTVEYAFLGERYSFSTAAMFFLSLAVGVIGGIYGIGGGAIIAPFCVAVFHLPVHTIAGATLLGTFITSVAGVLFYSVIPAQGGLQTSPDWLLGLLFGAGGFAGMYLGARCQKFVPQNAIKLLLGVLILIVVFRYVTHFFS
ncbi:MAG: sulfite exporter TauE/SafE family protein [Nitrospiraceae bacterium]|nr:MAG: sulfite exporter TauE/SafE family protein [Nitrospiraceae bacterium]